MEESVQSIVMTPAQLMLGYDEELSEEQKRALGYPVLLQWVMAWIAGSLPYVISVWGEDFRNLQR
jgi:hypothetical protein